MTVRSARQHIAALFDGSPQLLDNRDGLVPGCMDLTWGDLADAVGYTAQGVVINPPWIDDDEIKKLRDVLADYACPGLKSCTVQKLKDGTCIKMMTGECGNAAHDALEHGWQ